MGDKKEYIERGALIEFVKQNTPNIDGDTTMRCVERALKAAPAADVVEVKHGEWIYHECVSSYDGAISGYSCSECCSFVDEEIFDSDVFHKDFCGHCGAKMDGERNEQT